MASENETVADIAKRVRRECNSYPLPTAAAEMLKLVRELEAAHVREMEHRAIIAGASLADSVDEEYRREVAELHGERDGILRANASLAADNDRLRKEVEKLIAIINSECSKCGECAKFGKDCAAGDVDGAEDNRACEKFVNKEVAELREFSNDMRTWFRLYYSCGSDPKSKWWRSCATCRRKSCVIHKWRKALKGAGK